MKKILYPIQTIALYLILLIAGGYGGLHVSGLLDPSVFGVINPAGDLMPPETFAAAWQWTDGFMRVRMGICGPIIMYGYIITLILFVREWRGPVFWLLLAAFGLFMADVVLTFNKQMPINQYIQSLDVKNLNAADLKKISSVNRQLIQNFKSREWFSLLGFALVALTPFLWGRRKVS
jgi:hypothetical protein